MLVGPLAPRRLIHDPETIRTLAELGVMLLLGYGAARGLGWVGLPALLAAGMVAISSTMVVSRTLAERHADRRLRDIVFGVLVMEDLVAILLIAVLTTLAAGDTFSGPLLAATLARLGLFLLALAAGGMLVVPRAINAAVALRRPETTLVAAL